MHLSILIAGVAYRIDAASPIDLSIPVDFSGAQPHAFGLPRAESHPVDAHGFVGDTRRGGSCNVETITLNPHGSGTHTECAGHVTRDRGVVADAARDAFLPCTLITVAPTPATRGEEVGADVATDRVVSRTAIEQSLVKLGTATEDLLGALVIRTLPNGVEKRSAEYSGTNPPYLTVAAMHLLRELGVEHLVVDLPSVDREDDGGSLAAHRIFFGVDENRRLADPNGARRTITEMAYVPDSARDGNYLLNLQLPAFLLDAAPSRPILFALIPA